MTERLRLKEGIQKQLIDNTKEKTGLSWNKLSKITGVAPSYLRIDLRYEKRLLPKALYALLCKLAGLNYDDSIIEKLPENWGQIKGGKMSKRKERMPHILVNAYSNELAEIIGIMLGDGNIWERKGFYYVRIAGHSKNDREYLLKHVKPLFKNIFNIKMGIYKHKSNNELFLTKGSKDLVFTLKYYGLKSGDKIKKGNRIPKWIFESDDYIKACIRGLIDTDGTVLPITGRPYSYIWFTSGNYHLREDFENAMKKLGYKIAKWNHNGTPETYIGRKELIRKYYKEIGFNNPKHSRRFMCPGGVARSN